MKYEQRKLLDSKLGRKSRRFVAYGPEWTLKDMRGYTLRYIENASRGLRVRSVKDILGRCADSSWYVDSFQGETTDAAVIQFPARNGACRYLAATSDAWNADAYMADFADVYDDEKEAARAACSLAERYAELLRDDEAQQMAAADIENAGERIKELRSEHSELVSELRGLVDMRGRAPKACAALRAKLAALREDVKEQRRIIKARTDNYWSAVPY